MNTIVDKVAEAVLYEGYILYPYRASSQKNRERFTFGRVYPEAYSEAQEGAEPFIMKTQCLVRRTGGSASMQGHVRFLHPMAREVCAASPSGEPLEVLTELRVDDRLYQTWHEAVERDVELPAVSLDTRLGRTIEFYFPGTLTDDIIHDANGAIAGVIRRRQHTLAGEIEFDVEPLDSFNGQLSRVTVRVSNLTSMSLSETHDSEQVLLNTLASTHTVLYARDSEFISLTDPPADYSLAATTCENIGTWPVLVGDKEKGECDTMLSSPIILYDYPEIAPESPGDLCDNLEIDEILNFRNPWLKNLSFTSP
jgi:hydrogenase maturation protease